MCDAKNIDSYGVCVPCDDNVPAKKQTRPRSNHVVQETIEWSGKRGREVWAVAFQIVMTALILYIVAHCQHLGGTSESS